MIKQILETYRYMSADEKIKGERLFTSYEFPYLCYGNMKNKFVFDGYDEEVLAVFDINHKLLFKGSYEDCFKKFIKKEI